MTALQRKRVRFYGVKSALSPVHVSGSRDTEPDDLLHAMQALSQLSYGPNLGKGEN